MRRGALGRIAAVAPLLLVAIPFLAVTIPPSADLPQHVAQIRLLHEALGDGASVYRINWLGPDNLVYAVLDAFSTVAPPFAAGRLTLLVIALAWVGATAWIARSRNRPPEAAVLAAVLIFQAALYWGFLNFLIGWPVFAWWMVFTAQPAPPGRRWRTALSLALGATLLYASHALWFAVGLAWLVVAGVATRAPLRMWLLRMASVLPTSVLAVVWHAKFAADRAQRFDVAPHWFVMPWSRLSPSNLLSSTLGGVYGPTEVFVGACLVAWIVAVLITKRKTLRTETDGLLLLAAVLVGGIVLVAPDMYLNTIRFASRWMPIAVALLLVALPAPAFSPAVRWSFAVGALAATVIESTSLWMFFEQYELAGLQSAIEAVPPGARVLGLDSVQQSQIVTGRPFLQMAAWAQAEKGGTLGFSFAEHGSGIVSYREPRHKTWTLGLEWHADAVTASDFQQFDYVLVNGQEAVHEGLVHRSDLSPVSEEARWRLYRVHHNEATARPD